jgi:hypothetical protein
MSILSIRNLGMSLVRGRSRRIRMIGMINQKVQGMIIINHNCLSETITTPPNNPITTTTNTLANNPPNMTTKKAVPTNQNTIPGNALTKKVNLEMITATQTSVPQMNLLRPPMTITTKNRSLVVDTDTPRNTNTQTVRKRISQSITMRCVINQKVQGMIIINRDSVNQMTFEGVIVHKETGNIRMITTRGTTGIINRLRSMGMIIQRGF